MPARIGPITFEALVMEEGRMRESVTRSTGVPVLEGIGTIGSRLGIGEKKRQGQLDRKQGFVGTEPPMFYSHLTLNQNMIHFDNLGCTHTYVCHI